MSLSVTVREWQTVHPGSDAGEMLAGQCLRTNEERQLANDLRKANILEVTELRDGLHVRSFAHVGRIRIGPVDVTVVPKIAPNDLLRLVRYAYGVDDISTYEQVDQSLSGQLFQDLLIGQLVALGDRLIARGLARRYVAREAVLASPRGRIDLGALAAHMPLVNPALPCRYRERSPDHLLNRVLLAGVELGARLAQTSAVRRCALRLASRLRTEVAPIALHRGVLARAWSAVDRLTTSYEPVLSLVQLLVDGRSIALEGETDTPIDGFLFDMNRFFQALLGRFLSENLDARSQLREEHALRGMMRYVPSANPRSRRAPTPRPDFCILEGDRVRALLDAKYRDLWEKDLPRDMLYQLAIYAMSQPRGATSAILYPTAVSSAREMRIEVREPMHERTLCHVALRPVVLGELLECVEDRARALSLVRRFVDGEGSEPAPLTPVLLANFGA